ncbi:MAG TPA: hypothetical protein PKX92_11355 [Edaphocola sp.]|nr:hypothetical protein [Edaphocola sp.]
MKKLIGFLIIFIATGVSMWITNPKVDKHKEAVFKDLSEVLMEQKDRISSENKLQNAILKNLDQGSLDNLVKPFVDIAVSVEDYKVFSLTKLDLGEAVYNVGIGIFGKVFIFPQLKSKVIENIQQFI